jgi:hypothetical protein
MPRRRCPSDVRLRLSATMWEMVTIVERAMPKDERTELVDHLNRCRDLLTIMRDPTHRVTIIDLITFLESKLADADSGIATRAR